MPELPEVETIVRKVRPHLVGRTFARAEVLWERTVDRPTAAAFCRALVGCTVHSVTRRGKYLLFALSSGDTWLVHLRMTGKFFVYAAGDTPPVSTHTRARFTLDNGLHFHYDDQRKFGRFYLARDPVEVVGHLGPEPLEVAFTVAWLTEALHGRRGEIKRLLLDQTYIAGLGNIYVSEALWQAGIHPQRSAGTLTPTEATRLHTAIIAALQEGITNGGTSLGDRQYVYPDGGLGRQQERLMVYDRAGATCSRCGYAIERLVQGQRSTYFCPVCQGVKIEESAEKL